MNYDQLASIVFAGNYPGHTPHVHELPNGDGKVDAGKRYAHIASKYLRDSLHLPLPEWTALASALYEAHALAHRVAVALGVPEAFMPKFKYGALRVLEYPAGATSNLHTDMDLFTLMIYRDQPECFVTDPSVDCASTGAQRERLREARKLNPQLHLGELGERIGLGPATPHEVIASETTQRSIVYFAIPDHDAVLPSGQTMAAWLDERMSRSRAPAR